VPAIWRSPRHFACRAAGPPITQRTSGLVWAFPGIAVAVALILALKFSAADRIGQFLRRQPILCYRLQPNRRGKSDLGSNRWYLPRAHRYYPPRKQIRDTDGCSSSTKCSVSNATAPAVSCADGPTCTASIARPDGSNHHYCARRQCGRHGAPGMQRPRSSTPRFSAGVRAGASGAVGGEAQDTATSGLRAVNISIGPYSSTAPPVIWAA
jgi:hypothetical protein